MKVFLLLMLAVFVSCSDDKSTSPNVEKDNFPIIYNEQADELFESIIGMRDTLAFGNYTPLDDPLIIVDGTVYNFYTYTSIANENYFKSGPFGHTVFETDSTITYLSKRSFLMENTNNLKDSIIKLSNIYSSPKIFEGTLFYKTELAINLVGRKNIIVDPFNSNIELIGKERVDVYFLMRVHINEPLERETD